MIITMRIGAPAEEIEAVADAIRDKGFEPLVLPGEDRTAIGIPATLNAAEREDLEAMIGAMSGVSKVTQTSRPYKLASREVHPTPTIVSAGR
ncbi:3-deoxy-7-phosphoheptulonate synthase, partial [bacterium]